MFVKDHAGRIIRILDSGRTLQEVLPCGYTHTFIIRHPGRTVASGYYGAQNLKDNLKDAVTGIYRIYKGMGGFGKPNVSV